MENAAKRFVCKSAANQGGTYAAGLFRSFAEVVEKTSGMGCRAYKTPALSRRRKVAYHAGKEEPFQFFEDVIAEVISSTTGIPVFKLTQAESKKLLNMEAELHKRIIGQDEAVHAVAAKEGSSRALVKGSFCSVWQSPAPSSP